MIDAGGAIPWRIEVIFHVGIVGEELSILIEATSIDIAESRGKNFIVFTVSRNPVNHTPWSQDATIVAASVWHAG